MLILSLTLCYPYLEAGTWQRKSVWWFTSCPPYASRSRTLLRASGQSQQEWLRDALAAALDPDDTRPQDDGTLALRLEAAMKDNARLEDSLRDARQSKDRLEVLLAQSQDTVSRIDARAAGRR